MTLVSGRDGAKTMGTDHCAGGGSDGGGEGRRPRREREEPKADDWDDE